MEMTHHAAILRSVCPCEYTITPDSAAEQVFVVLEKFGIDDARDLVTRAYQRPQGADWQQIIVQTEFITHEAQNALLKVLEEPPVSTRFLFVVPPDVTLLPTLASRFSHLGEVADDSKNTVFTDFLAQPLKDRLAAIETAAKKKDVAWQRSIKQGLITYVKQNHGPQLADLEMVARLLLTRGASNKMLLEHVALTLPVS